MRHFPYNDYCLCIDCRITAKLSSELADSMAREMMDLIWKGESDHFEIVTGEFTFPGMDILVRERQ